jgi:hypothetical protein
MLRHRQKVGYEMSTPNPSIDRETLRMEIQSAIAAGRELEPSLDEHLANSVIDRYLSSKPRVHQVMEAQHMRLSADAVLLRGASLALSAGVIIAMIISHTWWMYWLILPIMGMLMAIFNRDGKRRAERLIGTDAQQPQQNDRRHYKELRLRYKIEKLEAKRALINGFSRGFRGESH